MNTRMLCSALLIMATIVPSAAAQGVEFEKMLFPVIAVSPVPGALGSQWVTDVSLLNAGSAPLTISGSFACFFCLTVPKLPPGITYRLLPDAQLFLLVEKGHAGDIRATVRIHDVSRDAASAGADVPFARESDFSADRIDLLGIPTDARFRKTLRIYSLDPIATDVEVREYIEAEGSILSGNPSVLFADTLVGATTVHLAASTNPFAGPAYAEVGNLPSSTAGTVRLEIRPLVPGTRIWAFLSLTNNETQAVTIIRSTQ